jgi:hypothetical protein
MAILPNDMFSGFPRPVADPIFRHHTSMRRALDLASIRPIQLISFSLWLDLHVSLNSNGRIPTDRSNSLHDHHNKNTKPIKTLIYICISPYAHIPNLKISSYGSDTTEGIWGPYTSAKQNFFLTKQELLLSEITGLPLDVLMQRNRLDIDERVEGSRQCSCSRPSWPTRVVRLIQVLQMQHLQGINTYGEGSNARQTAKSASAMRRERWRRGCYLKKSCCLYFFYFLW